MSRFAAFVALESCLVVAPRVAWAQNSVAPAASFAAGAIHLLTEPDHLLAIFALALLAGQVGRRALLWTPVGLSAGLLVGALSGAALPPLQQVEAVNLASIAVFGAVVALGAPLPVAVPGVLGLLFGWGHGYANALDIGGKAPPHAYILGVTAAALVVVISVSTATSFLRVRWQEIAVRAVGSWICVIGLMVFALWFAGD
jgi:urease accessory protein